MLRGEREQRIDELIERVQRAADLYRKAAEYVSGTALEGEFDALARERGTHAERLGRCLKDEFDDLPSVPDADHEALQLLLIRIKTAVAADELVPIVRDRIAEEEAIAELAAGALAAQLPAQCEDAVRQVQDTTRASIERLKKHL